MLGLEALEDRLAPATGLVAAYNFDQGSGTTLTDVSGNGNNGSIVNATWTTAGKYGNALSFNGTNAVVNIPNASSLQLTTGMTLEAWVNLAAAPSGWQDIIYKGNDNYYLESSSYSSNVPVAGATVGSNDTGAFATAPLPTNTWSFLTETYNGSTLILYVNGVQVASQALSGSLATSTDPLQIGGDSIYGQYFQGLIDNVRIYNTALTTSQIQADMNTPIVAGTPPPTTPANLTATANGNSITLNWAASSDAIGVSSYVVERENPGSSSFVQIGTTTGTTFTDTGLTANSTYSYKVQAVDWAGNQSAFSSVTSATILPAPTGLTATAGNGQATLSWSASSGATSYNIYRSTTSGGEGSTPYKTGVTTTSFTDTGLTNGTTYYYQVSAVNAGGQSPLSTEVSAKLQATGSLVLAIDAGGKASGAYIADAYFSGGNTYANSDTINTSNVSNPAPQSVYDSERNGNFTYTIGNLTPAADYTVRLDFAEIFFNQAGARVFNVAVNGSQVLSNFDIYAAAGGKDIAIARSFSTVADANGQITIQFTSLVNHAKVSGIEILTGATAPPTPTGVTATVGNTQATLNWSASPGATSYNIYRSTTSGGEGSTPYKTGVTTTSFTDTGLTNGTTYYYEVSAVNAGGESPVSTEVSARPVVLAIDAGGKASGAYIADAYFSGGNTYANSDTINTSNVSNPAPQSVYDSERNGNFTYTIGNLTPGASYRVRLDFAEIFFNQAGARVFNVAVNGSQVLSNFDIYAAAGGKDIAIARSFSTVADANGQITIQFTSLVNHAKVSGIEILPVGTAPTVTGVTPANGATNTSPSGSVQVTFSEALDPTTVNSNTVQLLGPSNTVVAATVSYNSSTNTATLTPSNTLASNTTYTVLVHGGNSGTVITDTLGDPLATNFTSSFTTGVVPSGLIAAYNFDQGSGTTLTDVSGNGNNGSIVNATWTTAGKYGNALSFNGTNAVVNIPNAASLQLTTGMTLEAWVNLAAAPSGWQDVIYKGNDNYFLESSSQPSNTPVAGATVGSNDTSAFATAPLPTNTWSFLTETYNGSTLILYVNGVQVASQAVSGSLATSTNPLQIGGDSIYGQYFQGLIDNVRIYNTALTTSQIQADMNTPIAAGTPPPTTPANLTATASGNTVTLNWGNSSDAIGVSSYVVERENPGSSSFVQIATTTGTTFSDTNVTANSTYSYEVQAVDWAGNQSAFSNVASATVQFGISPTTSMLQPGQTQQFTANATGVIWSVNGVVGGSANTGTITSTGLYTAPTSLGTYTITGTTSDGLHSASASIYVTNYTGTLTARNDNMRTGANLNETTLTPANVNSTQFGKLFSYPLDGIAFASPLYVPHVNIPGLGYHNVVYVATEHDSVYAFDADGQSTTPLWHVSFINPSAGITPIPAADTGELNDIPNEIGITGTPVIDATTGTIYLVADTKVVANGTTTYYQTLHALDIATGAEKFGGPVIIQGSVPGTGSDAVNGTVTFNPLFENQHAGLLLSNGVVYIAFASHGDYNFWHGWVFGYNASTLQQVMIYNDTANGDAGGIWMGTDGLASDSTGNIYFTTGNGTFDANTGGVDYGDSAVKLSPSGQVLDYFTPYDQATLDSQDLDLASGGVLLLPDQNGAYPHEMVFAGKQDTIYVVNRDNMGHFNSNNNNQIIQSLNGLLGGANFSSPVYYNGYVYFAPVNGTVHAFQVSNGLLSTTPTSQSATTYGYPGAALAISANGATNGILWAVERTGATTPGVLHAYLATNLADELYNSNQAGSRDTMDLAAKYSMPVVANGKVYVGGVTQLTVYGLLPVSPPAGAAAPNNSTAVVTGSNAQPVPGAAVGSSVHSGVSISANQPIQAPVLGFVQQQAESVAEALARGLGLALINGPRLDSNVTSGLPLEVSAAAPYRNPLFLELLARVDQDDSMSAAAASSESDLAILDALFASPDMLSYV